jgi:hypothetical protein
MCITEKKNRHQTPSQTKCNIIIIPVEQGFREMPNPDAIMKISRRIEEPWKTLDGCNGRSREIIGNKGE